MATENFLSLDALGIIGSVVVASVSSAIYISSGFRSLERSFYKALDFHAKEDAGKFTNLELKVQRVEIHTGLDPIPEYRLMKPPNAS